MNGGRCTEIEVQPRRSRAATKRNTMCRQICINCFREVYRKNKVVSNLVKKNIFNGTMYFMFSENTKIHETKYMN